MPNPAPKFSDLTKIEEEILVAKLKAVRSALLHAPEKGRALENAVLNLVRGFLPSEYGLSTGFVVYHSPEGPKLSSQLDIIIYDAIRSGPIIRFETCDVFPLEAVYGYIEVKSAIRSTYDAATAPADNSIEMCLETNKKLRDMVERRYWVDKKLYEHKWEEIISFIFAFEPIGVTAKSLELFAQRIGNISKQLGPPTHLHGVIIPNHGFFSIIPTDGRTAKPENHYNVQYISEHPLLAFKSSLLRNLCAFPRFQDEWSPAIDQYYTDELKWNFYKPNLTTAG
jgi:hypothetical protein